MSPRTGDDRTGESRRRSGAESMREVPRGLHLPAHQPCSSRMTQASARRVNESGGSTSSIPRHPRNPARSPRAAQRLGKRATFPRRDSAAHHRRTPDKPLRQEVLCFPCLRQHESTTPGGTPRCAWPHAPPCLVVPALGKHRGRLPDAPPLSRVPSAQFLRLYRRAAPPTARADPTRCQPTAAPAQPLHPLLLASLRRTRPPRLTSKQPPFLSVGPGLQMFAHLLYFPLHWCGRHVVRRLDESSPGPQHPSTHDHPAARQHPSSLAVPGSHQLSANLV